MRINGRLKMPRGMKPGTVVSRVDRYAAVKLRQRIREAILEQPEVGCVPLFKTFISNGWVPEKANGELLDEFGFRTHFKAIKKDLRHPYSEFFISFLHRAAITAYKDSHKRGKPPTTYNGSREIRLMTGLQGTTIKDILILNGEIR